MKRLLMAIKKFFIFLYHKMIGKITDVEIEDINEALARALKKRDIQRRILKAQVYKYLNKTYSYKGSKYIPIKGYNYELMHNDIEARYGDSIRETDLKLSRKLIWSE